MRERCEKQGEDRMRECRGTEAKCGEWGGAVQGRMGTGSTGTRREGGTEDKVTSRGV